MSRSTTKIAKTNLSLNHGQHGENKKKVNKFGLKLVP